jgi:hypothetical protein
LSDIPELRRPMSGSVPELPVNVAHLALIRE